ncbi:hypothetical protein HUW62_41830 [Myxococcus sp. AM011]|uniref:hypothetical protein n=1 Tax=Myxococcus sp. AM011 TaxID=2745200 RepID=UPI0015955DD3|nr:hypothetical protein [Myxococcus sp. AM011]NVJ27771.1 hypothetical protein [Myxococcus sp. AM011]
MPVLHEVWSSIADGPGVAYVVEGVQGFESSGMQVLHEAWSSIADGSGVAHVVEGLAVGVPRLVLEATRQLLLIGLVMPSRIGGAPGMTRRARFPDMNPKNTTADVTLGSTWTENSAAAGGTVWKVDIRRGFSVEVPGKSLLVEFPEMTERLDVNLVNGLGESRVVKMRDFLANFTRVEDDTES